MEGRADEELSPALANEARGDWSNLRGTEYHLVYVLWCLLLNHAESLEFYAGNDLRALPKAPPLITGKPGNDPPVPVHISRADADMWIQLKSTEQPWTPREILAESTLLPTFIYNALLSEENGRDWHVRLITQAPVRKQQILDFVQDFCDGNHSGKKKAQLVKIVEAVQERLSTEKPDGSARDADAILKLALAILTKLADTKPIYIATMRAEVETELALAYPDRAIVPQMAQRLLGRLLEDTSAGPGRSQLYNRSWLDATLGRATLPAGLLHHDAVGACDAQVASALPLGWNGTQYVPRDGLHAALSAFLESDATVFVLAGTGGSGVSWSVAYWAAEVRKRTVRLLVPGSCLDHQRTLSAIVSHAVLDYSEALDWRNEHILAALEAAASVDRGGPFVLILDGVVPVGDIDILRRDVGRLVEACRARRIKLVLGCHFQLWTLYHLGRELDPGALYSSPPEATQPTAKVERNPGVSFKLPEFSPPEQRLYLSRTLSAERAEAAILALRSPQFVFLRNPYFLSLYRDLVSSGSDLPSSLDIDGLLDQHIRSRLLRVAEAVFVETVVVTRAFDGLVGDLWALGGRQYRPRQARDRLEEYLPRDALEAFRDEGLLIVSGSVHLEESALGDRIVAAHLSPAAVARTLDLNLLQPVLHSGVVMALVRDPSIDPIRLAEDLLAHDRQWLSTITAGISQRQHWADGTLAAALSFLTCLARPTARRHRIHNDACFALGRLATQTHGRGRRAYTWLASMFVSDYVVERTCAIIGVSELLDVDSRAAEALMRLRMRRSLAITDFSRREGRSKWLDGALAPLRNVNNSRAASVGQKLLRRYSGVIAKESENHAFLDDIASSKGPIAFYSGAAEMRQLLDQLATDDVSARREAAGTLKFVLYHLEELRTSGIDAQTPLSQKPADGTEVSLQECFDVVCRAIASEQDYRVLEQLLTGAYHFGKINPDVLLDAMSAGIATRWDQPNVACSQFLILLGNLAALRPERVYRILPQRLAEYPGWQRAYYAELLAYTWWLCAEHFPAAREVLAALGDPDVDEVEEAAIPFALRGAAIAQMGLLCLGHISAAELLQSRAYYSHYQPLFLHLSTDEFVARHAGFLIRQAGWSRLRELLSRCIAEEARVELHPVYRSLHDDQYRCAKLCLEILIQGACAGDDVESLLQSLPQDWPALHAAWRVIEGGRNEPLVLQQIYHLAVEEQIGTTIQAAHDRTACLRALGRAGVDSPEIKAELEIDLNSPFSGVEERALTLAERADANPATTVALVEYEWRDNDALAVIHRWGQECDRWQCVLMARIFMRMLDERPIHTSEASYLCQDMCTALEYLPPSLEAQAWLALYRGVLAQLRGSAQPHLPEAPGATNLLTAAHSAAAALLYRFNASDTGFKADWVLESARDRRHWIEIERFGSMDQRPRTVAYFVPAMRLVLCALGARVRLTDPASQVMYEKRACDEELEKYDHTWSPGSEDRSTLEAAAKDFCELLAKVQWYEQAWLKYGDLLLQLGHLDEAKIALRRAAVLARGNGHTRSQAHYDLACVFMRQGRTARGRVLLTLALRGKQHPRQHVLEDPDLESIRGEQWFTELVEAYT